MKHKLFLLIMQSREYIEEINCIKATNIVKISKIMTKKIKKTRITIVGKKKISLPDMRKTMTSMKCKCLVTFAIFQVQFDFQALRVQHLFSFTFHERTITTTLILLPLQKSNVNVCSRNKLM